eukprot:gene7112-8485_t
MRALKSGVLATAEERALMCGVLATAEERALNGGESNDVRRASESGGESMDMPCAGDCEGASVHVLNACESIDVRRAGDSGDESVEVWCVGESGGESIELRRADGRQGASVNVQSAGESGGESIDLRRAGGCEGESIDLRRAGESIDELSSSPPELFTTFSEAARVRAGQSSGGVEGVNWRSSDAGDCSLGEQSESLLASRIQEMEVAATRAAGHKNNEDLYMGDDCASGSRVLQPVDLTGGSEVGGDGHVAEEAKHTSEQYDALVKELEAGRTSVQTAAVEVASMVNSLREDAAELMNTRTSLQCEIAQLEERVQELKQEEAAAMAETMRATQQLKFSASSPKSPAAAGAEEKRSVEELLAELELTRQ